MILHVLTVYMNQPHYPRLPLYLSGPAVSTFAVQIQSTTRAIVMWSAPPPDAALLMYQLEVGRPGGVGDRITTTFTPSRDQTFLSNLSPGTTYEFIIRGLFEQGLLGADTTVLETTIETGKCILLYKQMSLSPKATHVCILI